MKIALLRHGPTEWNVLGRVQGHTDIGLSEEGLTKMSALRLPAEFEGARLFASTLSRTQQTAAALGLGAPMLDARLMEQRWGHWEGLTHDQMRKRDGEDCFARAGLKTAFRPPGGESTAELMARVSDFFRDVAKEKSDAVAVTHLGVLRAAYTLATGWTMDTVMPEDLDLSKILVLSLDADGTPALAALNRDFSSRTAPAP